MHSVIFVQQRDVRVLLWRIMFLHSLPCECVSVCATRLARSPSDALIGAEQRKPDHSTLFAAVIFATAMQSSRCLHRPFRRLPLALSNRAFIAFLIRFQNEQPGKQHRVRSHVRLPPDIAPRRWPSQRRPDRQRRSDAATVQPAQRPPAQRPPARRLYPQR